MLFVLEAVTAIDGGCVGGGELLKDFKSILLKLFARLLDEAPYSPAVATAANFAIFLNLKAIFSQFGGRRGHIMFGKNHYIFFAKIGLLGHQTASFLTSEKRRARIHARDVWYKF